MVETVFGLKTRQDACPHHWRIGTPSGETSSAICLICGASRRFNNYAHGSYMALGRGRSRDAKHSNIAVASIAVASRENQLARTV